MSRLLIKEPRNQIKSPSQITREDYQLKKLINWSKKLKEIKEKMRKSEILLMLRTNLKAIYTLSETP